MNKKIHKFSISEKYYNVIFCNTRRGLIATLCILLTYTSNAVIINKQICKIDSSAIIEKGCGTSLLITSKDIDVVDLDSLICESIYSEEPYIEQITILPLSDYSEITMVTNSDNINYGIITNSSLRLFKIFIPSFAPAAITTSSGFSATESI